jgi:flagellar assembly protein FliH
MNTVNATASAVEEKKPAFSAEPLVYRSLEDSINSAAEAASEAHESAPAEPPFDLEACLQAAREQGRREAIDASHVSTEQRILAEREAVTRTVQQFEAEKQRYFGDVEQEVVKLSLAIAERVLHRESAMDPTFLAGAARVALEQVADSSDIVLRVSAEEADRWIETMKSAPKGMIIEADEAMQRGECVLKTRSGTVQLGLRAQLQEIERGFFELLGRRPGLAGGVC